jgi:hypothetical protein
MLPVYEVYETLLRDFLACRLSVALFRRELRAAIKAASAAENMRFQAMDTGFELFPRHLIQLCDSVLAGELEPALLPVIGRCLSHSGRFYWRNPHPDGRLVAEVLASWCAIDPACGLSQREVAQFREWIARGRPPAPSASH